MNNVVITRSKNQILDISEMITQLGMNPVEFPCIEIDSSSYKDSLYGELTNLNTYDCGQIFEAFKDDNLGLIDASIADSILQIMTYNTLVYG